MPSDSRDLHALGICVHVSLAWLHGLGVLYNARRRNPWQAGLHALVVLYDTWAIREHWRELR